MIAMSVLLPILYVTESDKSFKVLPLFMFIVTPLIIFRISLAINHYNVEASIKSKPTELEEVGALMTYMLLFGIICGSILGSLYNLF